MAGRHFDVVLLGEVTPGVEPRRVHRRLAKRFKREPDFIASLLGRGQVAIKKNVDFATAVRYRDAVRADGAECKIVERVATGAPRERRPGGAATSDSVQAARERTARERVAREAAAAEAERARRQAERDKARARAEAERRKQAEAERANKLERAAREQAAARAAAERARQEEARAEAARREQEARAQAERERKEAAQREKQRQGEQRRAEREQAERKEHELGVGETGDNDAPETITIEAPREARAAAHEAQAAPAAESAPSGPRRIPGEPGTAAETALVTEPELVGAAALLDKTPTQPARRNCLACGFAMPASEHRCPRCGVPVRTQRTIPWPLALGVGAVVVVVVAVAAILYYPQYRESLWREKITTADAFIREAQAQVGEFIANNGVYPRSNQQAGLPFRLGNDLVAAIKLREDSTMQVTYAPIGATAEVWTQLFSPVEISGEIVWVCTGGTLPDRFKHPDCLAGAAERILRTAEKTLRADPPGIALRVPRAWRRLEEIEQDALLGVGDLAAELYVIVVDQRIRTFRDVMTLDEYAAGVQETLRANLDEGDWESVPATLAVNGLDARRGVLRGAIDGIESTYLVTVLRHEDRFFQVIAWTLSDSYAQHSAVLTRVSDSFAVAAR